MRSARAALAHAVLILALAACDSSGGKRESATIDGAIPGAPLAADLVTADDLVRGFGGAARLTDTVEIDLGAPEAQSHLIEGWSTDEKLPDGSTVVWAMGGRSALWFHVSRAGGALISFRAMPYWQAGWPQQEISFLLNGKPIGKRVLAPGPRTYLLELPPEHMRLGRNLIDFEYAYSGPPAEVGQVPFGNAGNAVLWHWIRFHGAAAAPAPTVDTKAGTLTVEAGASVEYYVDAPAESVLVIDGVRLQGKTALAIEIEPDGGHARNFEVKAPEEAFHTRLGDAGIKRIAFTALRLSANSNEPSQLEILGPAVMAPPSAARASAPRPPSAARPPNIMLYMIDTLRADHLGAYGYPRPTSPRIDAFAREAVVFTKAIAQASWTRPAAASVFTGLNVRSHGIVEMEVGLAPAANTLAEQLKARGYRTAGFTLNKQIDRAMGFAQGFDVYEAFAHTDEVVRVAEPWLRANAGAAPLFLFAHTIEPHNPYDAEPVHRDLLAPGVDPAIGSKERVENLGTRGFEAETGRNRTRFGEPVGLTDRHAPDREGMIALYDAEVRDADAQFGRFLDILREKGLYDDSIIVLIADHGEEFYEHGRLLHGMTLYAEQLRVPMIIKFPNGWSGGRRFDGSAAQVDIMPTVLDYIGSPPTNHIDGRSLLADIATGDSPTRPIPIFSLIDWRHGRAESVIYGRYKLIHNLARNVLIRPTFELFDLEADPSEQHNLSRQRPVLARFLRALLRGKTADNVDIEPVQAELSEDVLEQLRALGYIK